jgi:uracil-DNA glycosylase family 4
MPKPKTIEIRACEPWLVAEIAAVGPRLVVALGATAGAVLFGPAFRVTRQCGQVIEVKDAPRMLATVHPSAILRAQGDEAREEEFRHFVADLKAAVTALRAA